MRPPAIRLRIVVLRIDVDVCCATCVACKRRCVAYPVVEMISACFVEQLLRVNNTHLHPEGRRRLPARLACSADLLDHDHERRHGVCQASLVTLRRRRRRGSAAPPGGPAGVDLSQQGLDASLT